MWQPVIDRLTAHGYRCLAPRQRVIRPELGPNAGGDYRFSELLKGVSHPIVDGNPTSCQT